jgi:hypothetical protein
MSSRLRSGPTWSATRRACANWTANRRCCAELTVWRPTSTARVSTALTGFAEFASVGAQTTREFGAVRLVELPSNDGR